MNNTVEIYISTFFMLENRVVSIYYFMKVIKKIFVWFTQVGLSVLVVAFLCIAPFSVLPGLLKAESEVNKTENYEYQGILERKF